MKIKKGKLHEEMVQQPPQKRSFLRAILNRAQTRLPLGHYYYGTYPSFTRKGPSSSSPLMHEGEFKLTFDSSVMGAKPQRPSFSDDPA